MDQRKDRPVSNALTGVLSQIISTLFSFVIRSFLIRYVGIGILGLNSTFASILNALSLAELGFSTAVVYSLYKPIHDNDERRVNDLLNIFRLVYRFVGLFFIAGAFAALPVLRFVLTDVAVTREVYVFFLLQASASAATYFIAYKRTLLYADRKDYVSKIIDIITFTVFSVLELGVIAFYKSYGAYLILRFVQVIVSNITVNIYCNRHYGFLHRDKINKELFAKVFSDVKDIFMNRIAGYVYSSTDSLVISALISTVLVGFYNNYVTVISGIRLLSDAIINPLVPSVGNALVTVDDGKEREKLFIRFSHLRYVIAILFVVPSYVLIDEFITLWVGPEFVMSRLLVVLIILDLYIHIVHSSAYDFINTLGLFRKAKYIEIAGAALNILTSVIFTFILGIEGVLLGTVISQLFFWIARSILVYKDGFKIKVGDYARYWLRNLLGFMMFATLCLIGVFLTDLIRVQNVPLHFILSGLLIEAICIVIMMVYPVEDRKVLTDLIRDRIGENGRS